MASGGLPSEPPSQKEAIVAVQGLCIDLVLVNISISDLDKDIANKCSYKVGSNS